MTQDFEATEPRDKIFAVVRLSHGISTKLIDYECQLREIVMIASLDTVNQTSDALSFVQPSLDGDREDFPTWAARCSEEYRPLCFQFPALNHSEESTIIENTSDVGGFAVISIRTRLPLLPLLIPFSTEEVEDTVHHFR